jgi:hypothetical protein
LQVQSRRRSATMADEDLSDEQLQQLLKDAEQRLKKDGKIHVLHASSDSLAVFQSRYALARFPTAETF